MAEPLVSVKMITYNHAPYIAQAIEGILGQRTKFPIELVIGEDCSTDGTREIVFEYQKRYPDIIRVITSDKNVGMKKNGYRTTKACRGKYLAFCEGDDYWVDPEKLQKQVGYMEEHPECGMVLADCDLYYETSKEIVKRFNWNKGFKSRGNMSIEDIVFGKRVKFTCTVLARKDLYDSIRESDPYLHQNEKFMLGDMQAWAEISMLSRVEYFPESLGIYRVLDESATRSKDNVRLFRYLRSVYEMKLYLCEKHKLQLKYRKLAESALYDSCLRLAFHERNRALAEEVKRRKGGFTLKEWFRYYGSKYLTAHYAYRGISFSLGLLKKEKREWP